MIYECADHRNDADISATWEQLIQSTHAKAEADRNGQYPYEAIVTIVKDMADRLTHSEGTFNPAILIPMIEKYAFEFQNNASPRYWVPDLFIEVGFPHETIVTTLQNLWYSSSPPFNGERRRRVLAEHFVYVCDQWYEECVRTNTRLYGSDEEAVTQLRRKIQRSFR